MLVGAGLDPGQRFPRIGVRFADGRTAGREATFRGHLDVGKDDGGIPTEPILTITGGGGCHRAALRHARSATQRASDHRNAAFGSLTRGSLTRRLVLPAPSCVAARSGAPFGARALEADRCSYVSSRVVRVRFALAGSVEARQG